MNATEKQVSSTSVQLQNQLLNRPLRLLTVVLSCLVTLAGLPEIQLNAADYSLDIECLAVSPDGSVLATGSNPGTTINLRRIADGTLIRTLTGHKSYVHGLAFSPDGTRLFSGGGGWTFFSEAEIRMWRLSNGDLEWKVAESGYTVAFSPDGTVVASAEFSEDPIRLRRASDGTLLRTISGHPTNNRVSGLVFSADSQILASSSGEDSSIKIWQLSNGALLRTLRDGDRVIAFSPDGKMLASAHKLWRLADGSVLQTFSDYCDAISPDWSLMASGGNEYDTRSHDSFSAVNIYRLSDGARLRTMTGYSSQQMSEQPVSFFLAAFLPDGSGVIGSSETELGCWSLSDGTPLWTSTGLLAGHNSGGQTSLIITKQPRDQTATAGTNVTFTVATAGGTGPVLYQWRFNREDIIGATQATLTLNGIQPGDAGSYTVSVSDNHGSIISQAAVLTVHFPFQIYSHPQSDVVPAGASVSFAVGASGADLITYQWRFNGQNIPSETSSTLTVTNVQPANGGRYSVAVANSHGVLISLPATLTVLTNPEFVWNRVHLQPLALAPDGATLAGLVPGPDVNMTVKLWRVPNMAPLRTFADSTGPVVFSPDGRTIATRTWSESTGGQAQLWRVSDAKKLITIPIDPWCLAFSPDGALLALGSAGQISLWDLAGATLHQSLSLPGVTTSVSAVAFSPDGSLLASGNDKKVQVWRTRDGVLLQTLPGHPSGVTSIAFSPDGTKLAAAGGYPSLFYNMFTFLWRVSDGNVLWTTFGSGHALSFSPDGNILYTSGREPSTQLLQVSDGLPLRKLNGHVAVSSFCWIDDQSTLAVLGGEGNAAMGVDFWRNTDETLVRTLSSEGHDGVVEAVAFSRDGTGLATAAQEIILWHPTVGTPFKTLPAENWNETYNSVAWSADGSTLASGGGENDNIKSTLKYWRVSDGKQLTEVDGSGNILAVAFSPDGSNLLSINMDGTVKLVRSSDESLIWSLTQKATCVAFSPDGKAIVLGLGFPENSVQIRRASDGGLVRTLDSHANWVCAVAVSPDGAMLASGSTDCTIKLWRATDGSLLRTLKGHGSWVQSLDFSPDANILASSSKDGTIRIWKVSDGSLLQAYDLTMIGPSVISFSPDGRAMAYGCQDGTVGLARNPYAQDNQFRPHMVSIVPSGIGAFLLTIDCQPLRTYNLQASTDLLSWFDVTNVTSSSAQIQAVDWISTNFNQRFYRTIQRP
jgi:WD40 repeat protein